MTVLDNSDVGYSLDLNELFNESAKCRSVLQNNEDKIEEFSKWSENMVRFVKTILEEASKMAQMLPNLESQISKFASFQDAFGVYKTVEAFDTISNLLRNTQSSNFKLITNISSQLLVPLQKYFHEDFKSLKDSRKSFDKTSDRYDSTVHRYYSLSKFKDVSDLDEELVQLYDSRTAYLEQYSDHATKINNFKETIDLMFLEKITVLIENLSDFFKNLSENFNSVKLQLDKGREEFERLNKKSEENRAKNESERDDLIQKLREKWDPEATIVRNLCPEKSGSLLIKRKKTTIGTPWKRIFAIISNGQFSYENTGKIRGTLESHEKLNVMMCEIRPIDFNDRRFCFEIYTGQQAQIYQAESEDDMMDWINTFHAAKSEMVQKRKSPTTLAQASSISEATQLESIGLSSGQIFNYGSEVTLKKWNEELHKQFNDLIDSEVNLCSNKELFIMRMCIIWLLGFPASLHTDIWTQGRVFVSQYAVYFYSSLFGIGTKIIIPLKEIMKIDVAQTSFVTVVNFTISGDSKDLTLKTFNTIDDSSSRFIDHLQLLHRNTQSVDPSDADTLFNEIHSNQNDYTGSINEIGEKETILEEESVSAEETSTLPVKEINCGCLNHMEKRSLNTIIPIDCVLAFELMFGPKCPVQHAIQVLRKNRSTGYYKITDWKADSSGIDERLESYLFPLNNPLVRAKETDCYVTLKLTKKIPGRCYVVDCTTNTPNIPYADSFYTNTRYCITWAGPEQTRLSICLGITWLKNPFVKSIIKSAAYKAFDETCTDYMACLRQEIASKIGPVAISGETLTIPPIDERSNRDTVIDGSKDFDFITKEKEKIQENDWITLISGNVSEYKIFILIFFFAFLLGGFIGNYRFGTKFEQVLSSYDLELEVLREFNVSKTTLNPSRKSWSSKKFKRTHSQLSKLHEDFATVRKSIWYTLQRVDDLERRVYKAEIAALLGDRLLACYDQKNSTGCLILQEQWKALLKDK